MAMRDKLKAALPSLTKREAQELIDYWQEQSPTNRFRRSAHWQALGVQAERNLPRLRELVGKPDATPGDVLLSALSLVNDDTRNAELARAMGGSGKEPREMVLAHAAAMLGFENTIAMKRQIEPIASAEMADRVALKRFVGDIENRRASGRGEEDLPDSPERVAHRNDDAERRNLISNLYAKAEAGASPVQRHRRDAYQASTPLGVDIERAMAAHEGRAPLIDRNSPGAKKWLEERNQFEVEDAAAEAGEITQRVQGEREFNRAIESGLQRTNVGAAAIALGGDEVRPDVQAYENAVDNEEN